MADYKITDLSKKMRKIDICMFTTQNGKGVLSSRPMSNNGDVEYDGNSYFFSYDASSVVKEVGKNPQVCLQFEGKDQLYISVTGKASLITSRPVMEKHWIDELNKWFEKGLDTPGITMIHVKGSSIKYWQNENQGELKL